MTWLDVRLARLTTVYDITNCVEMLLAHEQLSWPQGRWIGIIHQSINQQRTTIDGGKAGAPVVRVP